MITLVFGSVGSGKSSYGQWYVDRCLKKKIPIFANCEFGGSQYFNIEDFGKVSFPIGSCIVIDEASISFNNRQYKTFPKHLIEYLKLHRHYGIREIVFISQDYEDIDITIRRLATNLIHCRKIFTFGLYRPVSKFVLINKETSQIEYGYRFNFFTNWRFLNLPRYWHKYSSFEEDKRPLVVSKTVKFDKRMPLKNRLLYSIPYVFIALLIFLLTLI